MPEPRVLYVLRHRPGPASVGGSSVFDDPRMADHLAFLRRRLADETLVAAGPLDEDSGQGMTILAVGSRAEALRLAETDDTSVVAGLLAVEVLDWQVALDPGLHLAAPSGGTADPGERP